MAVARHEITLAPCLIGAEAGAREHGQLLCVETLSLLQAGHEVEGVSLVLILGIPSELSELAFLSFVEPYLPEFVQHELLLSAPSYQQQQHLVETVEIHQHRLEVDQQQQPQQQQQQQQQQHQQVSYYRRKHALITLKSPRAAQSFVDVYNNLHFPEFPLASPALVLPVVLVTSSTMRNDSLRLPTCSVCLRRIRDSVTQIPGSDVFPVNSGYSGNRDCCNTCFFYGSHLLDEQMRDGLSGPDGANHLQQSQHQHLDQRITGPSIGHSAKCNLDDCNLRENIWLCLVCSHAGCGRYTKKHAEMHYKNTRHPFALELVTGRIWDYEHDNFVHACIDDESSSFAAGGGLGVGTGGGGGKYANDSSSSITINKQEATKHLYPSHMFHNSLFAQPRRANHRARTRVAAELDRDVERKITCVQTEYEVLLESQLEAQSLFFEKMLAQETVRALELAFCGVGVGAGAGAVGVGVGGRTRSGSGIVGKAVTSSGTSSTTTTSTNNNNTTTTSYSDDLDHDLAEIELRKLDISALEAEYTDLLTELRNVESESRKLRKANEMLIREQKEFRERENEIKLREAQVVKKTEERTTDLQQQLVDLRFFLSARKKIQASPLREEVQAGSIVVKPGTGAGGGSTSTGSGKKTSDRLSGSGSNSGSASGKKFS